MNHLISRLGMLAAAVVLFLATPPAATAADEPPQRATLQQFSITVLTHGAWAKVSGFIHPGDYYAETAGTVELYVDDQVKWSGEVTSRTGARGFMQKLHVGTGRHTIRAVFVGNDSYLPAEDSETDDYAPEAPWMNPSWDNFDPTTGIYSTSTTLGWYADIPETTPTGHVEVRRNGVVVATPELNDYGAWRLDTPAKLGDTFTFHYAGDENYAPGTSSRTFVAADRRSVTKFRNPSGRAAQGKLTIVAELMVGTVNIGYSGLGWPYALDVTVDGRTRTIEMGPWESQAPLDIGTGTKTVTIRYAGNSRYTPAEATFTVPSPADPTRTTLRGWPSTRFGTNSVFEATVEFTTGVAVPVGTPVQLQFRPRGTSTWRTVATTRVAAHNPTATFSSAPVGPGDYRAYTPASSYLAPSTSNTIAVQKLKRHIGCERHAGPKRTLVICTAPPNGKATLYVRRSNGTWKAIQRKSYRSTLIYSVRSKSKTQWCRIVVHADAVAESANWRFRVPRR
ncbi:hypothetical protein FE697_006075 [Mumia zhuanghuii]|uniref:Ig-like domain (Group 3) n=2 Tax=Mumia TaxID=1546255 RepID=A0ABW1QJC6_9ACTN|nr:MULTISPECIES: hypothetical protein [Mumia]KAA1425415.1 hypothetical protein FE697_006075 [Mumia zhuanghuii]